MGERFLVVAATRAETTHLPPDLPLVITGIGKTMAAVATAQALAADPEPATLTVLNVGSAGALKAGISGLHVPGTVLNHDLSAEAIRALGEDPREVLDLPGGSATVLASGDVFVSDTAVRDALAQRADLVDMEGYAVAFAAQAYGARVELVKHVSDNADESALEWNALVEVSARALGAWVAERTARVSTN